MNFHKASLIVAKYLAGKEQVFCILLSGEP